MKNQLLFIITFFTIGTLISSCNRQSKVSGVVTYFFNHNFGQKPDVGAEIYFLEKGENDLFDFTVNWTSSKVSPNHRENISKISTWQLEILKGNLNEKFIADSLFQIENSEAIDRENAINYFKSLMKNDQLKCTANGNGEFNISLPKGHYYVLVVFSHRDAIDISLTPQDFENDTQLNYAFEEYDL
jgi:hypothetical protein